ncbi:MAG: DNA repair protein RadA [Selenomonadaceae bacterium]|nr:DNA repair protein RadA [Selenomonadaceae bacterium]
MAKKKIKFVCQECGAEVFKKLGRCPSCGNWNTIVEEVEEEIKNTSHAHALTTAFESPKRIAEVDLTELPRFATGSGELDRVLGGGLIPGSIILIAGDPGVGKSSLTLAFCAYVARNGKKVLYVTGEESSRQIRMRAERLNALADELFICAENNLERIIHHAENLEPELLIVDSIQTIYKSDIESAPGSVSQVRECSAGLMRFAKSHGVTTFVIGHVTKDGNLAGPRVLEHIVDTVLFFEGERTADFRVLRAIKNRFGATSEIGLFEMRDSGLVDVPDASKLFLPDKAEEIGSVIIPTVEGTRPLLVEIQALVAPTPFMPPRRTSDSVDVKRIQLLLAVLEKRLHLSIGSCDVYVKTAGGIKIDEPAADLPIAVSLASSFANRKLLAQCAMFGEVGLSGEIRAVSKARQRIDEVVRMGFKNIILPKKNFVEVSKIASSTKINLIPVESLRDALKFSMPRETPV